MDELRSWLVNRVTITLAVLAMAIFAWNVYVLAQDDGVLAGRVLGPDGAPVPGAEVVLNEQTIVSLAPIVETSTDAEGRFQFVQHGEHHVVLTARKEGVGESGRVDVRLWFRNQNRRLREPLRLKPR